MALLGPEAERELAGLSIEELGRRLGQVMTGGSGVVCGVYGQAALRLLGPINTGKECDHGR
jgi:hypothetical protein